MSSRSTVPKIHSTVSCVDCLLSKIHQIANSAQLVLEAWTRAGPLASHTPRQPYRYVWRVHYLLHFIEKLVGLKALQASEGCLERNHHSKP